jgi:hypothetical protein
MVEVTEKRRNTSIVTFAHPKGFVPSVIGENTR